jgi:DNA replication protein DnaC
MKIPESKFLRIKDNIKNKCKICDSTGCDTCAKKMARITMYAQANIPMEYWDKSFKNFEGDRRFKAAMHSYVDNIDGLYDEGISLGFSGSLGTGKTYMAACFLKIALTKGYSASYYNMSDMIQESMDNRGFFSEIIEKDFIVIDEYDLRWVYPTERAELLFGQTMERVLRHRFQNGLPTILCSNTPDLKNVLAGDFSRSTGSLFSKFLKQYTVSGIDYRKKNK